MKKCTHRVPYNEGEVNNITDGGDAAEKPDEGEVDKSTDSGEVNEKPDEGEVNKTGEIADKTPDGGDATEKPDEGEVNKAEEITDKTNQMADHQTTQVHDNEHDEDEAQPVLTMQQDLVAEDSFPHQLFSMIIQLSNSWQQTMAPYQFMKKSSMPILLSKSW